MYEIYHDSKETIASVHHKGNSHKKWRNISSPFINLISSSLYFIFSISKEGFPISLHILYSVWPRLNLWNFVQYTILTHRWFKDVNHRRILFLFFTPTIILPIHSHSYYPRTHLWMYAKILPGAESQAYKIGFLPSLLLNVI